ncbi:MAG: phosphotransferase [Anaerolineales bacterium]|jgi:Ser/Thr protein kinase RdoA (MazF antagonist)|nr:phosphotransferase [Anaerolineales bacterium]
MKPYEELTRLGRIRRMRDLAFAALENYGVLDVQIKFLRQAGNTLFRVRTDSLRGITEAGDLFLPGQYLLRIHQPGYQEVEAIELELAWLSAMRREADLPVPEPIPTLDGRLLLLVEVPGVPGQRNCSLLRWIKGRSVKDHFGPAHLRMQGRLMARLHNFSTIWQPPAGLCKRRFDWDGLFVNDVGSDMPNADAWKLLSPLHRQAFSFVAERLKEVMEDWGEGSEVFGLIHGDLGVDANLLFWHGEARAIDFDDSGYGYWIFDLAVALDACREYLDYARYRKALLEGYAEYRGLPEKQVAQLELFLAGLQVYWNLWATGGTHLYPDLLPEYAERMAVSTDFVVRYARQNGGLPEMRIG